MRILIADDHVLVRAGLKRLLESFPGVEVVAEADQGQQALELAAQHKPDAVLLDLSMPGMGGMATLIELKRRHPEIPVLILSMHEEPHYVRQSLTNGARGYVVKNAAPSELEFALRTLGRGQVFVSPRVSHGLIERRTTPRARKGTLSRRQREVLKLIASGKSTREIATALGVSVKTVETHRARMMESLDVRGTHGLMRYALQSGFDVEF